MGEVEVVADIRGEDIREVVTLPGPQEEGVISVPVPVPA